MSDSLVVARGLTRAFEDRTAVSDLSLDVRAGSVLGVLGPNGSGKSTTVRLLTGLLRPTSGWVDLFGERLDARNAPALRHRIGVQTEANLYLRLTVTENLRTWGQLFSLAPERLARRIDEVLEVVGLGDRRDTPVGALSKGLRQKAAIARALLHEPELLFLDEPTAGLDPGSSVDLIDHLAELRAAGRTTIVLCTHQLHGLERFCDDVVVLDRGRVVAEGRVSDLMAEQWPTREHVIRVDDAETADLVVKRLEAEGVAIRSIEPVEPSLHDLYFRLLERGSDA